MTLTALSMYTAASYANNVVVVNTTACQYTVVLNTIGPVTVNAFQTVTIPSPLLNATGAKVSWVGATPSVYVEMFTFPNATSATVSVYPTCIPGGNPFLVSWNQANAAANVLMQISS